MKIGQCATLFTTQNINPTCADGHTQTDFTGTFGDGYVHDIHDTDTAHYQRYSGNTGEQGGHQIGGRI